MSDLEDALAEFSAAMLAKFHRRASRHPEGSVTVDGNLCLLRESDVERHYLAEVRERFEDGTLSPSDAAGEDVDVANLAFLDWWLKTH